MECNTWTSLNGLHNLSHWKCEQNLRRKLYFVQIFMTGFAEKEYCTYIHSSSNFRLVLCAIVSTVLSMIID